jgi:hypothetical protein
MSLLLNDNTNISYKMADDNNDLPPPPPLPGLCAVSSEAYRGASQIERSFSDQAYEAATPAAESYSAAHGIPVEEARKVVDPNYSANKWGRIPLEGEDAKVGTQIRGKEIQLVCNSNLYRLYNDTYSINFTGANQATSVTYRATESIHQSHSGDMKTPFGLRHIITFKGIHQSSTAYILSASWTAGQRGPITELAGTNPILEIRAETNGDLKRYVIPQDFSAGGNMTACVNASVTWDGEYYTVTIMREFIRGFADDVNSSIADLKLLMAPMAGVAVPMAVDDQEPGAAVSDIAIPDAAAP